jgi:hypothetical protein
MEEIRKMVQPLYDDGDLVGFSICGDTGEIVYNESFFSDEVAWQATAPFVRVMRQMQKADRVVNRLSVELEDVILIYGKLDEGHALFTLDRDCDLDRVAEVLS